MITRDRARGIVMNYLKNQPVAVRHELVVLDELTREEDFGWIFFYNTKRYAETRDTDLALAGNAPLIVDSETGALHVTGTAQPIEHYVDEYKKLRNR